MDDEFGKCSISEKKYVVLDFNETEWHRFKSKYTLTEMASIFECNKYLFQLSLGQMLTIHSTNIMNFYFSKKFINTDIRQRNIIQYIYKKIPSNTIDYNNLEMGFNSILHLPVIFIEFNNFTYNEINIKNFFYSLKKFHMKL